ncbi:MAG TPA: hypothetical protein VHD32_14565 [Candidatus Didemnitutus sp.]|nr:hypothetical protein [Candidatus Didemnitutus sp.]
MGLLSASIPVIGLLLFDKEGNPIDFYCFDGQDSTTQAVQCINAAFAALMLFGLFRLLRGGRNAATGRGELTYLARSFAATSIGLGLLGVVTAFLEAR